jgi:hypothetical protein
MRERAKVNNWRQGRPQLHRHQQPVEGPPLSECHLPKKGSSGGGFGPGRRTQRRPWPANGWPTNGPGKAGGDRGSVRLGCWCRPQCRISYPISRRAFASRTTASWKYRVLRGSEIRNINSFGGLRRSRRHVDRVVAVNDRSPALLDPGVLQPKDCCNIARRHVLDVRRMDWLFASVRQKNLNSLVRVPDGTMVERALNSIIRVALALFSCAACV